MMSRILFAAVLALSVVVHPCRAEELTAEKRADIESLLNLTGALSLGRQVAVTMSGQIAASLRKSRPDIPEDVLKMLPEEVGSVFQENMSVFKEMMMPVYNKYYTGQDIKDLITFYASPVGQKVIASMPGLVQESMAIGNRWGNMLGPQIEARIKDRLKKQGIAI